MNKLTCEVPFIHNDSVRYAKENMLSDAEIDALSLIFKILSDPTRVRIVWAVKDKELCVCDLAATLDMTKSAISHQLKAMKENHIVKSRRDGKNIFYSLDDEHVTEIISLAQVHIKHSH